MKRTILALIVSVIWNLLAHFLPVANDIFTPIVFQGDHIKVFYRGWPVKYVAEGPLRDPTRTALLKTGANVVLSTVVVWLILSVVARIRSKKRPRCVVEPTPSGRFGKEHHGDSHERNF